MGSFASATCLAAFYPPARVVFYAVAGATAVRTQNRQRWRMLRRIATFMLFIMECPSRVTISFFCLTSFCPL